MSKIIENYYLQTSLPNAILQSKLHKFNRNTDIQSEFEHWIENKQYDPDGVNIEGYTAQSLSQLSEFLDGEGAFILLIELRECPDKALKKISQGFKLK